MSFQSNGGGALFTGQVSYAVVRNGNGQSFAPNTPGVFTIDTIDHLSSDFAATIGGTLLSVTRPGIYLIASDAYAFSAPLASGRLVALSQGNFVPVTVFTNNVVCDAIDTDIGMGIDVGVYATFATDMTFAISASQTDTVDRVLGGDLFAMRLGDFPS